MSDTDIFRMQLINLWHCVLTCSLCSAVKCLIPQISGQWFSIYVKQIEAARRLLGNGGFPFNSESTTGSLVLSVSVFRLKSFLFEFSII